MKHFSIIATSLALLLLIACGSSGGSNESAADDIRGTELVILTYEEYISPDVIARFEAETGVTVIMEYFADEPELQALVESDTSAYDVISASDALVAELSGLRLLAELDRANIPNLANIDPAYLDLPGDPGNKFSVPFDWGSTGVIYNTKFFEPEELSWAALRDPRLAGRVALDSDFVVVIGMTLKSLGYSLNSSDPEQLAEVVEILREQKLLLHSFRSHGT